MTYLNNKIKNDNTVLEVLNVNKLQNRSITDGNIWTLDNTFFSKKIRLFLVINFKTDAILGYILHQDVIGDDIIIELYQKLLECYRDNNPIVIHSDTESAFTSEKVQKFLNDQDPKIEISLTKGEKRQNQVSESLNERIKTLVTKSLITKEVKGLREWRKNLPNKMKHLSINSKSRNTEFRRLLFKSQFFKQRKIDAIMNPISEYNRTEFTFWKAKA